MQSDGLKQRTNSQKAEQSSANVPHLLRLAQPLGVQEVAVAPVAPVAVVFPLLVHVKKRQVVGLGDEKLLARGVALLGALRRPAGSKKTRLHVLQSQ